MAGASDARKTQCVAQEILDGQPSCIEFCPDFPDVFVVGSYKLEEGSSPASETLQDLADQADQVRSGNLSVFKLEEDLKVTLLQDVAAVAGVLDIHFSSHEPSILAVALSDGTLELRRLDVGLGATELSTIFSKKLCDCLILAVAWNPTSDCARSLAVTTSDGCFASLTFREDWTDLVGDVSFQEAHTLEAWTLAWLPAPHEQNQSRPATCPDNQVLYTGGDDAVLCRWELSLLGTTDGSEDERLPADLDLERHLINKGVARQAGLFADRRTHEAGVTAIIHLPVEPSGGADIVLTGSYDEHIRVLASAPGSRWKTLAESHLQGGVWRLKVMDVVEKPPRGWSLAVLASCMHAGCKVVLVERDAAGCWSISTLASFEEHQSMNYGSDFAPSRRAESGLPWVAVSTSFFDRRLCVWKPKMESLL